VHFLETGVEHEVVSLPLTHNFGRCSPRSADYETLWIDQTFPTETCVKAWVVIFLLIAVCAAVLAFTTLTGAEFRIAKSLAWIFGVLTVVALFANRLSERRR
jgi:uncharacterized membrane protein YtjA (UPF0391 family)